MKEIKEEKLTGWGNYIHQYQIRLYNDTTNPDQLNDWGISLNMLMAIENSIS